MKVWTAIGIVLLLGTALPAASAQERASDTLSPEAIKTIQAAIASHDHEGRGGKHAGKAAGLRGNPGQFFGQDEYPPEAIRNGEQGRVVARLAIGTDGRVTDCTVMSSSGSASLDSRTCEIALSKVVFTPATDGKGRPIAAAYTLPVRWVLPVAGVEQFEERRSQSRVVVLDVGADDAVISCRATVDGKPDAIAQSASCAFWQSRSPALLHFTKGSLGGAHAMVTIETAMRIAGQPIAFAHSQPGHVVSALYRAGFDILPDGSTANLKVLESILPPGSPPPPAPPRFVPVPGRTDKAELVLALSAEPVK